MPRVLSIATGLLMIAVVIGTFIWLIIRSIKRSEDPAKLLFKYVLSLVFIALFIGFVRKIGFDSEVAVIIPFGCVAFGVAMAVVWAPQIGALLAKPITSMFDGGDTPLEPAPLYSAAISRRKLGRYDEAIAQIRQQLEKFPDDFTGQLMLAEIQAENLNDLPTAQVTIQRICNQKGHQPASIAAALTQLADWQLRYWQDPDSARESLEQIRTMFPETELAHTAAQRIAHLATREQMVAAKDRTAIQMPTGLENVGLRKDQSGVLPASEDPALMAAQYVQHLEQHPLNAEIREKLALIYAEHYQRVDYAIHELEQILQQPGLPTKQVVRLLGVMADVHMKYASDPEAARHCLQRIIDEYPNSAAAEGARQRIPVLNLELRSKKQSQTVQMGSYDQDIGLKRKAQEE